MKNKKKKGVEGRMKHLCKNFIENGKCTKCRTPEWAIYFPEFKHKIGSKIKLPLDYNNGGEEFMILQNNKGNYTICKTKGNPIEWFSWWELYPTNKRNWVKKMK